MLGKDIRPETITVKFRFPDTPGVIEKVINVVAFLTIGLICINLESVGLQQELDLWNLHSVTLKARKPERVHRDSRSQAIQDS